MSNSTHFHLLHTFMIFFRNVDPRYYTPSLQLSAKEEVETL